MVTCKTDVETAYIVLIISDQHETAASWNTLFTQRNCIVLVESEASDAIQSAGKELVSQLIGAVPVP